MIKVLESIRPSSKLLLVFLGACLHSNVVLAAAIEEVVVTAQKRAQSVNDVPITISAFTGEKLQELGVVDARDLEKIVPSFKYSATGLNKPVFTLRGIGYNDFSQTASGTVGIYVGEFNMPYPVMAKGPTVDIERIEVLKGPQGTLYGRNTTGGVVNFIPALPGQEFEAGITQTYSRFETYDTEVFVSGPVTDSFGARLAVRKIKANEGWQYSLTRGKDAPDGKLGKQDKWSGRLSLEWVPTDLVSVSFGIDHWEDTGEPQAAQPIAVDPVSPLFNGAGASSEILDHPLVPLDTKDMRVADWPGLDEGYEWKLDDTFTMERMRVNFDVTPDATLSYLVSHADFESDDETIPTSGASVLNGEALMDVKTTALTHELRMSGAWGDDINYIFGYYASQDDVYQYWIGLARTLSVLGLPQQFPEPLQTGFNNFILSTFPGADLSLPIADKVNSWVDQHSETEAGFFDVNWRFAPDYSFTLGARYTDELRELEACTADNADAKTAIAGLPFSRLMNIVSTFVFGGQGGAGRGDCITLDHITKTPGVVKKELAENNWSGRMVLDWTPMDDWLLYLSFSRGYKSGGFPIGQASDSEQYRPSTQERLDAWEVGGKMSLLDQSVQLNFAIFDYDYRDKQLLSYTFDPIFGALQQLDNAPKSKVLGGEIDVRGRPTEAIDVFFAASYIDTEITEFIGVNQSGKVEDFSGEEFNNAPQLTASLGLRYLWDLPWVESFDLAFGLDYSYTSETSSTLKPDPRYAVDSYDNINARVSMESVNGDWTVTAWGRNITNEYQVTSAGLTAVDMIGRFVKMPQTYGVTVRYNFVSGW